MAPPKTDQPGIVVECYLDTLIITTLDYTPNSIHQNVGQVANIMKHEKRKHLTMVGVIDDDKPKNLPHYFHEFELIENDQENKLKFYKHKEIANRFLVKISPAAELWLEHCGKQLEKAIALPYEFENFKKISKSNKVEKDPKVLSFLNTLKQKEPPAFGKLKAFLKEKLGKN
jgi:hypothetical protein